MVWLYSMILASSAGLLTYMLVRTAGKLTTFLGMNSLKLNTLSYASLVAIAFLMVAQAPAMMLSAALILWFAGLRHMSRTLGFPLQFGLFTLAALLGLAALPSPQFDLPPELPKAAIMLMVYLAWVLVGLLPARAVEQGLLASYGASLLIFAIGGALVTSTTSITSDALVLGGALVGAWFGLRLSGAHHDVGGQWVFYYCLGFLMANSAYHGSWWLGLLGIAPVAVYTLVRK